ncbi:uncharacterized protein [Nicotiana sylvestris]|uniref:uncharacterized protein n=1 Tax=Nicotiana sylvestris TaxID=4096 RepID=UPI00388C806F
MPHYTETISNTPESDNKDSHIKNLVEELKKLTSRIQGVEGSKGIEGLNYEDLCIQPNFELPEGYKPPKFNMFDGTGDPRVHLRTYCDKLVGVGKDEKIRMKLFMRSLKGDALSWNISQDPKKWSNWVSMVSDFMDWFRFNMENAPDVFYIQNLKKKPTEIFREYATRWRSEVAKVRPALKEEQMNRFFVRPQDTQYYERLMLIEGQIFSYIIKLGEKIKEGIKSGMVTNFEALQATNKALQSGGTSKKRDDYNTQPSHYQSPPTCQNFPRPQPNFDHRPSKQYTAIAEPIDQLYERLKAASYVTPIPAITPKNPSQRVNPNKTYAYHSGMKGHTIDECRSLKDKIQALIDNKIIVAKEHAPNFRNNPLPDHKSGGIHMIEVEDDWDPKGSIGLIIEGDKPKKPTVTLNPIVVQMPR